jgi:hypothetical protein
VNVASGEASTPSGGRTWIATRPPVDLGSFEVTPVPRGGAWTTVTSWSSYGAAWWDLEEFRQKDIEYMRLRDLPQLVPDLTLELAISGEAPWRQLERKGWTVVDPIPVSHSTEVFRSYIAASRGEVGVAKQAYVKARTGAVNDRTLMYAASGRPVVCSDTGLDWLPSGEGFLPFTDAQTAAEHLRTVEEDPERHGLAARKIAAEHFSADRVVGDLLRDGEVSLP